MAQERNDHEPPPGLRSPLYGTATFTTLSNSQSRSTTPVPMSPSAYSSRLSYPQSSHSRSVTPGGSEDRDMRRLVLSPTASSYDSRRNSSASDTGESYTNEGDNSFDDREEVEATLVTEHVDDEETPQEEWSSGYSSSALSSSYGTGSQTTQPLNFDRERRVLSIISERTEQQSISSGASGSNVGGGLFSTLLSRPSTFLSNAAASSAEVLRRSLYGQPISPLSYTEALSSPRSSAPSLPPIPAIRSDSRPATPDRLFRPAPPTGRRVGDLVATFESNLDSPSLQRPLGPRSPSPYSTSRPSSPLKSAAHNRTATGVGLGLSSGTTTQTMSSLLSPPPMTGTAPTELTRSPFSSVRNIVSAWKERTPTRGGSSTAASSTVSGSRLPFSMGENIFSLRRRGAIAGRVGQRVSNEPPPYEEFGGMGSAIAGSGNGNGGRRSLERSPSRRSAATGQSESGISSNWDLSELSSLIRGNEEALRSGYLWYLNVHAPPPYLWQRCQAILYPSTLVLTWLAPGGGRGVVTLDLINCNEIRSVPAPSHPSARDDVGTIAARLQMDMARRGEQDVEYDLMDMLYPFQLIYSDGVERLGTESAAERVRWVGAIWEAIDQSSTIPDRSVTGSPTGSMRTIRSLQSSIRSGSESGSGDGSASTTFVPNLDNIPDLPEIPDFGDNSTFTPSYTQTESLTSFAPTRTGTYTATGSRVRSTDDGAISSRGFLHPLESRGIEITPSRSGSLRRTSSLTDLDARFASLIDFGDSAGRTRDGLSARGSLSRFSARWSGTRSREGSEIDSYTSSDVGDSVSQVGAVRRVPASTFYSLSSGSSSASSSFRTATSVQPLMEPPLRSPVYSEGTEIVASTLSLRRPDSASLLGDSHSGSAMSPADLLSPTTPIRSPASSGVISPPHTTRTRTMSPTRSYSSYTSSTHRTPESLYTSTSGLSRRSEVRRRTPRTSSRTYSSPRTVSSSARSGTGTIPSESSDKENEPDETEDQSSRKTRSETAESEPGAVNESSDWTSLDSRSYTTTSYDYSRLPSTRESTDSDRYTESGQYTESEPSGSESEDVFLTPTPSSRTSNSYHSARSPPGTPTPSIPSISTAYDTAEIAPSSTAYDTAEICPSTPPSTEYTTAEICPSTPPSTGYTTAELCPSSPPSTDYLTAECRCIPSEPSLRTEISSLSPTPSISELLSEKQVEDVASLYSPSEVPTIPSVIEEAEIPLPVSEDESLLADESIRESTVSEEAPSTPTSGSAVALSSSVPPLSPIGEAPSRLSLLSTASESTIPPSPVIKSASGPSLLPSVASSATGSVVPPSPPTGPSLLSTISRTASESAVPPTPPSGPSLLSTISRTASEAAVPPASPSGPSLLSTISRTASESAVPPAPPSGMSLLSSVSSAAESAKGFVSPLDSSLLSSVSSASAESASTLTPSSESSVTPIPSSLTFESRIPSELTASPSIRPISLTLPFPPSFLSSPSSPTSPSSLSVHTESDRTPKSKSMYVPSHTSGPSEPTVSEYDSSILAPSPSMQSLPTPEPVDVSFETSFFRPSGSEVFSEQEHSPFWPKGQEVSDRSTATPSSISDTTISFGPTVTVTRTPSTISSVSVDSYRSSILYPKSIWEEELSSPSTEPTLLTSRPSTPRAVSPRTIPIPSSPTPTPTLSTPEGTASVSMSSPRSERPSIHSLTSVASEIPPEDPFDRLFNLLDDLDAKREGENQDLKDHIRDLEDALRDLADHIKKPRVPVKDRSVGGLTPISETRPSGPRAISLSPPPSRPSPDYAPSSLTDIMSYLPSAHSDDELLEDYMSEASYPELPRSPSYPSESSPPTSPPSSFTPSSPTPSTITEATARPISDHVVPALDGLRDLLEDLRHQVQALWDGQLGTNRMLDDLVDRRLPADRNQELNDRLRNIEDTLGNILHDLARGGPIEESDQSPSELSSDTASALRRYIDRLRDARGREPQLHMPTPVRPPTTSIDAEWLRFLSEAPTAPEQPVQGPPPLVPLVRRTARPSRPGSVTPPPTSILSPARPLTAPFDQRERIRYDHLPRPQRGGRPPWTGPRVGQGIRPITPVSDFSSFYDPALPPPPSRIRRPEDDIDFLDRLRRLRAQRHGGDGYFDAQGQPPAETQTDEGGPRPPARVHTAPPAGPISETFYPGGRRRREDQTLADAGAPGAAPRPSPGFIPQQPVFGPGPGGQLPAGIPPPFPEMLDLLRQNRLAQTASIDQQREIMRYMRSLNDWLGRDVRDRQNEMQAISARVDALRGDLARMGAVGGMPVPQVQQQGPTGPTYIVPPMQGVQPGVVVPPMPMPGMPQPQFQFSPPLPSGFQRGGPGVMPGVIPTEYNPAVTPPFIPPGGPPLGMDGRVVPNFGQYQRYPQPGGLPGPMPDPGMQLGERPFIPPPMQQQPPIIIQQAPPMGMGPSMMSGGIPVDRSEDSSSRSPTPSTMSDEPVVHHVHHNAPSAQPIPPPDVERLDDPRMHGPLHPSLAHSVGIPVQPSMVGVPQQPQTIILGPQQPFAPQQQQPTQVIISSPPVRSERSHSRSPTHHTIVLPDQSRRHSRSRSRSRSYSRSPPDRVIVMPPAQQPFTPSQPPVVMMPDTSRHHGSRSRSRSRSSSPRVVVVPGQSHGTHRPRSRSRSSSRGSRERPHVVVVPTDRGRTPPRVTTEGDYGSRYSPPRIPSRRSPSPQQVIIQQPAEHQQPPVIIQQPPTGYGPSHAGGPPVIIQQPPTGYGPSHAGGPPVIIQQPSGFEGQPPTIIRHPSGREYSDRDRSPSPHRAPTYVLSPRSRRSEADEGRHRPRHGSRSRSPSPTHIQIVPPSLRSRSPSRRSQYEGDRPSSRSRSPRERHPTHVLLPSHTRTPSSRYHEVPEGAPSGSRVSHRSRSRSPQYEEGDRPYRTPSGRSPRLEEADRPYHTPSRHDRPLDEGDRPYHTPSRHDRPLEEGDRPYHTPSGHDRPHEEGDGPSRTPTRLGGRTPSRRVYPGEEADSRFERPLEEADRPGRTRSRRTATRISRSPSPIYEEDAGAPRPVRVRSRSPTVIGMGSPTPTTVLVRPPPSGPTAVPTYRGPETVRREESPPPLVIRRSTSPSPVHDYGALSPERTPAPSLVHLPEPSTPYLPTAHPTEARYSPPLSARDEGYAPVPDPSRTRVPSGSVPIPPPSQRPVSPRTAIESEIRGARHDEPVVPYIPSLRPAPTAYEPSVRTPFRHEQALPADDQIPTVSRVSPTPPFGVAPSPRMTTGRPPPAPPSSGPGDLTLYGDINERAQRLEEHEQRLLELQRAAEEAEEQRERNFRAHEDERERIFEDHEDRRDQEATARRDEIFEQLLERPALPGAPPGQIEPPMADTTGELPVEVLEGDIGGVPETASFVSTLPRPVPAPPGPPIVATLDPVMQEQMEGLMDMMRQCMAESREAKEAAMHQREIDDAVARAKEEAKEECDEHLRLKDEEIARGRDELARVLEELNRARDELEVERVQRRNEELERIEREERVSAERDEAVRNQLDDITNLIHQQQEAMSQKRELMDERWNEKQGRRAEKQERQDELVRLVHGILQDREQERAEREAEREANAGRPTIEQVLELLREQGERMQTSIDSLAEAWRADSARQHSETIEAVRATATEMVPYNLTGYLDEFSRALAGEVRTLIGEVGRLHEQKRTLQHAIAELFHMQSQYGPGGQFEPDWHASQGPLAPPPPGPEMPPPPPEEPQAPPPARPAWRTVQQRQPRRQRTRRGDQPPPAPPPDQELAPPERQQSWATWQPNPAFQPTPPPATASPLLVPPQGPQGLFGPRSPRNTQHYG